MEFIRNRLFEVKEFDMLSELINLDENINDASKILNMINSNISPKNLLSSFIIVNCSDEIIGKEYIQDNIDFINSAKTLIFSDTLEDFKINLVKYIEYFSEWKNKDFKLILDSLSNEYFQAIISILATSKNEIKKKILFGAYRSKILKYAEKLAGEEGLKTIKSYNPLKEFDFNIFDNDFWINLVDNFDGENYSLFYTILNFLKSFFLTIYYKDNEEIFAIYNVEYFKNILENNNYSNDDIKFFANKAFDLIKKIQNPFHHKKIEEYRYEVNSNSIYLPDILKNIYRLTIDIKNQVDELYEDINNKDEKI